MKALFSDFQFSAEVDGGLEMVDILTTGTRRALRNNLKFEGWKNIRRVMIDREEHYIKFLMFGAGGDDVRRAAYSDVVYQGFMTGGKPMVTKRNRKLDTLGSR